MADQNGQIRKRQSFQMWLDFSKFLDKKPSKREIMMHVHGILNGKSAYGSITKAQFSRESLEEVLKDDLPLATVKVGGSYGGDELMEALGGDMHDGLYALGNERTIVVAEDEGNDNYKVLSIVAR